MRSLYDINQAMQDLIDKNEAIIEENGGVIPSELEEDFNNLEIERSEKIGNYCKMIKNYNSEVVMLKNEIDNLSKRMKFSKNKIEFLKNRLIHNMAKGEKYIDKNSKITWRKSKKVKVLDETKLSSDYFEIEKKILKNNIKKGIELGLINKDIAILEENVSIQIK